MLGYDQSDQKEKRKKNQTQHSTLKNNHSSKQLTLLPVDPNKGLAPTQSIKDPTLRETRMANQKKYTASQLLQATSNDMEY